MKRFDKYSIDYKKYKPGIHKLNLEINDDFFDNFDYSEIKKGHIIVDMTMDLKYKSVLFDIHIKGYVETDCDICLEKFDLEIETNEKLNFIIGDKTTDEPDENNVLFISSNDDKIDLAKHLYDFIILSLPIKKVHPLDKHGNRTCKKEVLDILENMTPVKTLSNNPQWQKLKENLN